VQCTQAEPLGAGGEGVEDLGAELFRVHARANGSASC
jgi:hypothetical protein